MIKKVQRSGNEEQNSQEENILSTQKHACGS